MKEQKKKKIDISKYSNSLLLQLFFQSFAVLVTAALGFFFMTWLVTDVFGVKDKYLATAYESFGTLAIVILVLVPINAVFYFKSRKEVRTLSEGINKLAEGNFDVEIPIRRSDALSQVYGNFNKMCQELKSVQILRNDFINSYSHELKTPIASINGFAELLLEKDITDLEKEEYLKIIIEETNRLSKLASNTILLSKLSSQKIITDTEEYDLGEQIRQCSIILASRWMEKDIELSCMLPDVIYLGNRELMQHLWLNIISNAIDHTPQNGEIAISIQDLDNKIIVSIADSGEGMDEETLKHLFDPYFQGDSSHSGEGLGLGLPIAKRIAELCNGEIMAESKVGEGSLFTVILPK